MYALFASIGGKLPQQNVYPIFTVEKEFPSSEVVLILSDEPPSEVTKAVDENVAEIKSIYAKRGIPTRELRLTMEDFWENVTQLAVQILSTDSEKPVLLNFSTGRRVFVSTMLLAGSFALSWQPKKKIICVQRSKNYPTSVVFEPIPPVIPDAADWYIMSKIKDNSRVITSDIANELNKSQSTISIRIKKLADAGYLSVKGHSKVMLTKGKAILNALDELVNKQILTLDKKKH